MVLNIDNTSWCLLIFLLESALTVVTVNDYLAQRDAEWMGRVHRFLGLSVGLIQVIFCNQLSVISMLCFFLHMFSQILFCK